MRFFDLTMESPGLSAGRDWPLNVAEECKPSQRKTANFVASFKFTFIR